MKREAGTAAFLLIFSIVFFSSCDGKHLRSSNEHLHSSNENYRKTAYSHEENVESEAKTRNLVTVDKEKGKKKRRRPNGVSWTATSTSTPWLKAHNWRREDYHLKFRTSYVPLAWDNYLETSAQNYADELIALSNKNRWCTIKHRHNGNRYGGENLAADWSFDPNSSPATPEQILKRWTEDEEPYINAGASFSQWGHFTQVLWRATTLVGCGQASAWVEGWKCNIQVCRYLKPGNCNVNIRNWRSVTFADDSFCEEENQV